MSNSIDNKTLRGANLEGTDLKALIYITLDSKRRLSKRR